MRLYFGLTILWLSSALCALGQVTVQVTPDQEHYLAHESLRVTVNVTNFSGQTLILGDEEDWLSFTIENSSGFPVAKIAEVPVTGVFRLESSQVGTKRLDLAPYYTLSQPGRYTVTATVHIPQLRQQVSSKGAVFHITSGAKLWEATFGVPLAGRAVDRAPEVRKYELIQANYKSHQNLYYRVSNAAGTDVLRVAPLGRVVSFSRPEPQLDQFSHLHVLYQDGARTLSYYVIDPDGDVVVRQKHLITETKPFMRADSSGRIGIFGGARILSKDDVPLDPELSSAGERGE